MRELEREKRFVGYLYLIREVEIPFSSFSVIFEIFDRGRGPGREVHFC